jgi:ABC-type multidrug transport system ATPase subunit
MSEYSIKNVSLRIVKGIRPYKLMFLMVIYAMIKSFILPTLYLKFSSSITVNIHIGFKYFTFMILITVFTEYLNMKINYFKKSFVIDYISSFHDLIHYRIFGTYWDKIREWSQEKLRNKINRGTSSVQNLVSTGIYNLMNVPSIIGSCWIILNISPYSFLFALVFNVLFYYMYYRNANAKLVDRRKELHKTTDEYYSKFWKISNNTLDHVIHNENDYMIGVMKDNKVGIEKLWLSLNYEYNKISFRQTGAENICIWLGTAIFIHNYITDVSNLYYNDLDIIDINVDMLVMVIPLYTSLRNIVSQINRLIQYQADASRLLKDYEEIEQIMNDADPKIKVPQVSIVNSLTFSNLLFTNSSPGRKDFTFKTDDVSNTFSFTKGDAVLADGKSGAGKSTFFDILTGIIPTQKLDYRSNVYVNGYSMGQRFENIEDSRTMVLQDSSIDLSASCYDIIVGNNCTNRISDTVIWEFLRLVKIDDVFIDQFNCDLHLKINDKLSGGQKTRLMLARALFRASEHCRKSSILILDEPDKGLPSDMTIEIIQSIISWFGSRGILFITLHTKEKYELPFTQVLTISNGIMVKS